MYAATVGNRNLLDFSDAKDQNQGIGSSLYTVERILNTIKNKKTMWLQPHDTTTRLAAEPETLEDLATTPQTLPRHVLRTSLRGGGPASRVRSKRGIEMDFKTKGVAQRRGFMKFHKSRDTFSDPPWILRASANQSAHSKAFSRSRRALKTSSTAIPLSTLDHVGSRAACPVDLLEHPKCVDLSSVQSKVFDGLTLLPPARRPNGRHEQQQRKKPSEWFTAR